MNPFQTDRASWLDTMAAVRFPAHSDIALADFAYMTRTDVQLVVTRRLARPVGCYSLYLE
jgi:hypothetical protein